MRAPVSPSVLAAAAAVSSALAAVTEAPVAHADTAPREAIRLTYEAPPACPGEAAFLAQVRARVGTGWEAAPGAPGKTMTVHVVSNGAESGARLDYTDDAGQPVARTVTATRCEEVVSGIALVTALAIEARLQPESPAPAAPAPLAPAPSAAAPAPTPESPAPTPAPPRGPEILLTGPLAPNPPPPNPTHVDLGIGITGATGLGRALGFGAQAFAGIGWKRGVDLRLGVGVAETPLFEAGPTLNRTVLYAARASVCYLVFDRNPSRILPCAGAHAGVLHAEGLGSVRDRIEPGSATPFFFAPFVSVRGDLTFGSVFAELEVEGRFPVDDHRFYYSGTPEREVYRVPNAAVGAALSAGVRL